MKYFKRAYHDTFEGYFFRTLFLVGGSAAITFGMLFWLLGEKEAMLEVPFLLAVAAGTLGPLFLLFCWNLTCAPYRIERDLKEAALAELESTKAMLPKGPKPRRLNDEQKVSLAEAIRSSGVRPEKITVFYDESDSECVDFAVDISDSIGAVGIAAPVAQCMFGPDVRARGVSIIFGKSSVADGLASAISDELKHLGHGVVKKPLPDRSEPLSIFVHRSGQS